MARFTMTNAGLMLGAAMLTGASAQAFPISTTFVDIPFMCDTLSGPTKSDELGTVPPFPANEAIAASAQPTNLIACPSTDIVGFANWEVRITNLTTNSYTDVWYAGETATGFTNVDGDINGVHAFKIDNVGVNTPLIFESFLVDGIFSPGETWLFIIDDYTNGFGLSADAFTSLGVPAGPTYASGSIVASPIPSPGSIALLLGAGGLVSARRRRS